METIHWNDFRGGMAMQDSHHLSPVVGSTNQFASSRNLSINRNFGASGAYAMLGTKDLSLYSIGNFYSDPYGVWIFSGNFSNNAKAIYRIKNNQIIEIMAGDFHAVETVSVPEYTSSDGWSYLNRKQYLFKDESVYVYDTLFETLSKTVSAPYGNMLTYTTRVQDSILVASKNWIYEFKLDTESFTPDKIITDIPHGHIIKYMYFSNDVLSVVTEGEGMVHIYQFQQSIQSGQLKYETIYKTLLHYERVDTCIGNNNTLYILCNNGDVHMVSGYQTQKVYFFSKFITGYGQKPKFMFNKGRLYFITTNGVWEINIEGSSWKVTHISDIKLSGGATNGAICGELEYWREYLPDGGYRLHGTKSIFYLKEISSNFYRTTEIVSNDFFDSFSEKKEIEGIDVFYEINYSGISSYKDESRGVYTRPVTIEVYIEFSYLDRTFEQMENRESIGKKRRAVKVATIQESNTNKVRITGKEIRDALASEGYDNNFTNFAIKLVINNGGCRLYRSLKDRGEELWTNTAIIYGVDIHYNITDYEQK